MRLVSLVLAVVVSACGSVSTKSNDAGHDGPGSGSGSGMIDAAIDGAPPTPFTAIGAGAITSFTAAATADTKIPYVADYDDLGEWSNTASTFTAKNAGDYLVCLSSYLTNAFSTINDVWIYKNGTRQQILAQGSGIATGCRTLRLATNDTLSFYVFNNSNAPVSVVSDTQWQWLTIERVNQVATVMTSASFSSPSGQFVVVPYDTASINDGSLYNTTTHQLQVTQAGDYQFCPSLLLSGSTTFEGELDLFVNGTRERSVSNGVQVANGCRSLRLNANDAVDVRFFQNTATSTVPFDDVVDWFDIQKQPISVSVGAINTFVTTSHVFTPVPYSTKLFDDGFQFNSQASQFTAGSSGDYLFCASLLVPQSTVDGDELDLYKNGVREKGLSFGHFGLSGCRVMRLLVTDTVQVYTYTLGNKTFTNDANWDWLEVSKLH